MMLRILILRLISSPKFCFFGRKFFDRKTVRKFTVGGKQLQLVAPTVGVTGALMLVAADTLGYFSLGRTVQSSTRNYFEAPIRSNGNITLPRVSDEFGGRRYLFTVTVSYAVYTRDDRRRDDRPV